MIPGNVPNLIDLPAGCRFAPRCVPRVDEASRLHGDPPASSAPWSADHDVRCCRYHDPDGEAAPGSPTTGLVR